MEASLSSVEPIVPRVVPVTRIYQRNRACRKPIIVNVGGARSSKSHSVFQLFIERFINENGKTLLTTRKTFPALRISALQQVIALMKDYGIYERIIHNQTNHTFINPANGNLWLFSSIEQPERIRSTEWSYVHMEEANEFSWEDWLVLKTRMSRPKSAGEMNQIFLSLNPSDEHGWINTRLRLDPDAEFIASTYKDNPFLDAEYTKSLEALKDQDARYYQIYTLGQWSGSIELIYGEPIIVDVCPWTPDETIYGIDFGFNNETAVVRVDVKDMKELFITEMLYKKGMTNRDLLGAIEGMGIQNSDEIYADAAEPARIEEIFRSGYNIKPAEKDVQDGIDFCKRFKRMTTINSPHFIEEMRRYSWKKDKDGRVLDEPVKYEDHSVDAFRYCTFTHLRHRLTSGAFEVVWA